jgi:hypothetical protein
VHLNGERFVNAHPIIILVAPNLLFAAKSSFRNLQIAFCGSNQIAWSQNNKDKIFNANSNKIEIHTALLLLLLIEL